MQKSLKWKRNKSKELEESEKIERKERRKKTKRRKKKELRLTAWKTEGGKWDCFGNIQASNTVGGWQSHLSGPGSFVWSLPVERHCRGDCPIVMWSIDWCCSIQDPAILLSRSTTKQANRTSISMKSNNYSNTIRLIYCCGCHSGQLWKSILFEMGARSHVCNNCTLQI